MNSVVSEWHAAIGVVGMVMYLGSYFMLQLGMLQSNSATYCIANMLAASLVMVSLVHDFNLASALIQISWIAISAIGLARMMFRAQPRSGRNRRRRMVVVY